MSCVNKVILLGPCYSLKPIETKSGKKMLLFSLKTWQKIGAEEKKVWHSLAAYAGAAEVLIKNLKDGEHLYVEGRIEQYKDKDDVQRNQIVVEEFKFVSNKS
jgi:single-stranded DNA-binding protein